MLFTCRLPDCLEVSLLSLFPHVFSVITVSGRDSVMPRIQLPHLSKHLPFSLAWEQCFVAINKLSHVDHTALRITRLTQIFSHRNGCVTREREIEKPNETEKKTNLHSPNLSAETEKVWYVGNILSNTHIHTYLAARLFFVSQTDHDGYV